MKRARFSEKQIISVLKEAKAGAKVTELCRQHGISDATFYTWRSKYGGLEVSEMRRLRQLEEENRRLKSIVADQALDIRALKDVLAKNGLRPAVKRQMVMEVMTSHDLSQRRACGLIGITRRRQRSLFLGDRLPASRPYRQLYRGAGGIRREDSRPTAPARRLGRQRPPRLQSVRLISGIRLN
jgi:putative transposase